MRCAVREHCRGHALTWLLTAALVLAVVAIPAGVVTVRELAARPLHLSEREMLVVEPGGSFNGVVQELADRELVSYPWALRAWARISGRGQRIVAGEYALRPGTTGPSLLGDLEEGNVVLHALRLREGVPVRVMLKEIWDSGLLQPTLAGLDEAHIMEALGAPGTPAEGRFLPETYFVTRGESDFTLLARAHRALKQALEEEWEARTTDVFETPDEALILASIIEKETNRDDERARVAGVFVRRLAIGMPLQADPTVIYGLGENFAGTLTRAHLRTDTPWNTYTRKGLPATPITLPSRASIHAALNPADGESLYFVASGTGGHVFSATLDAHNAAVLRYRSRGQSP